MGERFQVSFEEAVRKDVPLLIAVEGPSSSGKTKSGLEICQGILDAIQEREGRPGKLFVVDTENRRALHYADDYRFVHYDMHPPFSPAHYAAALDQAEASGADVVFFDSFSHLWSGEGGVKDWADRLEKGVPKENLQGPPRTAKDAWDWWKDWKVRPVTSPGNWDDPKSVLEPGYRWFINRMLRSRMHVVVSLRSDEKLRMEQVPVMENDGQGGQRQKVYKGKPQTKTVITAPADLPILERFVPDCEKRLPYELTVSLLFVPPGMGTPGVPIHRKVNDRHKPFIPEDRFVDRRVGRLLAGWAAGAQAPADLPGLEDAGRFDREGELDKMKVAAARGTIALREAWTDAGKNVRVALQADLPGLQSTARAADEAAGDQREGRDDGRDEGRTDQPAGAAAGAGQRPVDYDGV